jgi:hypothetical protein
MPRVSLHFTRSVYTDFQDLAILTSVVKITLFDLLMERFPTKPFYGLSFNKKDPSSRIDGRRNLRDSL